jgi:Flp pilus assembly protein TadG
LSGPSRRRRRGSRGQALAEFALVAPFLFVLILGTIEAGRFIFLYELMNNATREGARYAIVHGADAVCPSGPISGEDLNNPAGSSSCDFPGSRIKERTQDAAMGAVGLGDLFVYAPVWTDRADLGKPSPGDANSGSNDRGNYVTVFIDYNYRPLLSEVMNLEVLPDITISAESTLVINY